MRKGFVLTSLFLIAGYGCASDSGDDNTSTAGTTGLAGAAGTAGGGTAGTGFGAAGTAGTLATAGTSTGGTSTGGTGGSGGSFVVPVGGSTAGGAGGTPAGGAGGGGAGGAAQGGGGAGGAAQGGGGAGGSPAMAGACSNSSWTFTPSHICAEAGDCMYVMPVAKDPANAIDGDPVSRYTSGQPQDGTENFVLDFGASVTITGVTLTAADMDGPAMYSAEYSTDGNTFMAFDPAVEGVGSDNLAITFPATSMQAIRVNQTGMKMPNWWSILEITVQGCTED